MKYNADFCSIRIFLISIALGAAPLNMAANPSSAQIASAIERGGFIYLYNERGSQIGCVGGGGSGPKDGLVGFTATSVSVRRGSFIYIYNAKGEQTGCVSAGN